MSFCVFSISFSYSKKICKTAIRTYSNPEESVLDSLKRGDLSKPTKSFPPPAAIVDMLGEGTQKPLFGFLGCHFSLPSQMAFKGFLILSLL